VSTWVQVPYRHESQALTNVLGSGVHFELSKGGFFAIKCQDYVVMILWATTCGFERLKFKTIARSWTAASSFLKIA
jgi:hypothetical protein